MRPVFVDFKLITDNVGGRIDLPVNVNSVISILAITIPGKLKDATGQPIAKAATGLNTGFTIITVDHNPKEVQRMLEGVQNGKDAD